VLKAPERDIWAAAARPLEGEDDALTVCAPDLGARVTFNLRSARLKRTVLNRPLPRWARYPAGVLLALPLDVPGLHIVMLGDEPAGPRYEHSLGVAFAALCSEVCATPIPAARLLELVEQVRRDYVES
jgi:hypothetical protein